ncbi:MAG: glycine--tRNA ligase subunit beta, partial [Stenotrophobium sp.]
MSKQSLLIELGTEDLPARYVLPLAGALGDGIAAGLNKRGVAVGSHKIFATPRRIAVLVDGVARHQPDQNLERKGPQIAAAYKDGKPAPAALGFAKSCGVAFEDLAQENGYLIFRKQQPGKATAELITGIFEETLKLMDELVPKRMRWGAGSETFVRPVQWIMALLGDQVIPLKRFGLEAGRVSYGHRFHAPAAITLNAPADYADALKAAKVWADVASRKAEIRRQIEAEAKKFGGQARITEDLLDEVTALVEWPVVISGHFEQRFLALPPEVIISTVETNQRYFTVFDQQNRLLPVFITIANIESRDVSQIISGNERVVRPRLSDAMFFWEQDLKQPLAAYGEKLRTVMFQKDLGSIGDKVNRIGKLATHIAAGVPSPLTGEGLTAAVARAATLCKNDLVTRMVYEFTELQGLMGGYYAEKSGEPAGVAQAIREHYLPTQQGTPIPSTREGQIVALADKLDTLAGIFAIGQKPTASKDPFALRRAALGVLRILIEGKLSLDVTALLNSALEAQPAGVIEKDKRASALGAAAGKRDTATLQELTDFVLERLRAYYSDQKLPVEMFEAVKSLGITTPLDFDARVQALRGFWALPAAKNLAAAHKRVRNILKQAADIQSHEGWAFLKQKGTTADKNLVDATEKIKDRYATVLHGVTAATDTAVNTYLSQSLEEKYGKGLQLLTSLREPVDAFFEQNAKVMDPDIQLRSGRITLLRSLDEICREVADISCLP